jgi:hypothetical protein
VSTVGAVLAVAAIAPAGASASSQSSAAAQRANAEAFAQTANQPQGKVTVAVDVRRFKATAAGPRAVATATATLRGLGGMPTTVKRKVTLAAAKKGGCNILTLTLKQLNLKLLGLNVHLDKVNLQVTGRRKGGVLGRLFCSLASARVKTASAAASRLNVRLRKSPMRPFRVTVPVHAMTAQAGSTCQVLDLVLGPLHVDLLGLVIDLNRVHLSITATRGGGVLGDLFCGLADNNTSG